MQTLSSVGSRSADILFAFAFVIFSVVLFTQIGEEAKFSANGKLSAQPAFWPAISIAGMIIFGVGHLWRQIRNRDDNFQNNFPDSTSSTSDQRLTVWVGVFEFYIYFMLYVWAVPFLGYLLATVTFTTLLAFRTGYRTAKMLGLAAASGIAIVVLFKSFLSVRIPGAAWYELLPDSVASFMIINF